jgi:hypothetical protein
VLVSLGTSRTACNSATVDTTGGFRTLDQLASASGCPCDACWCMPCVVELPAPGALVLHGGAMMA